MNREIKFRQWDKEFNKMRVTGFGINRGVLSCEPDNPIMQFTGLKDKNGKEIWEGDIVKWKSIWAKEPKQEHIDVVEWDPLGCWMLKPWVHEPYAIDGEVIGNIYETPELMENK